MRKFIHKVSEFGITPQTSAEQAHHYRLTNILLLFMMIAGTVETLVCFFSGAMQAAAINSTAPFVFGTGLWMMKSGRTVLARTFVLLISFTVGYLFVASLGRESYFQFIYLFASAFAIIIFSSEEKFLLGIFLIIPLIAFTALELTDYQTFFGVERAPFTPEQLSIMRVTSMIVIWLLMVFHFGYFIRGKKRLQEQLISSAKMVGMGRMAAGIAHEVNNPLQLIVSHAERLKMIAKSPSLKPEEIEKCSDQIQATAMRIASIVRGLLALSRDTSNDDMTVVQVASTIHTSFDYCRARLHSKNVELVVHPFPEDWTVVGRSTQISEVLLNVLNNAFDAVENTAQKKITINVTADSDAVEIAISDSGSGIPQEIRHRIFDPFFTTKAVGQGTGLGLSISQGIVLAHGGQIFLDKNSTETKFVIRLRRAGDVLNARVRELTV